MKLERMTWLQAKEYFARKDIAVIPLGSTENHGSHLALGTDFIVPSNLADRLDPRLDVVFTPTLPFGIADHHMAFPGTITLGYDGLYLVMSRITEALYQQGVRHFVFLNGHGGNDPVLSRLGLELYRRGALCALLNWWQIAPALNPQWKGGHGGGEETAAMLAVDPALVRMQDVRDYTRGAVSRLLPASGLSTVEFKGVQVTVPRGVDAVTPTGWDGPDHPAQATAQWGQEMLEAVADFMVDFIQAFEQAPLP